MLDRLFKSPQSLLVLIVIYVGAISYVGYVPTQSDFARIIIPYTIAFITYLILVKKSDSIGIKGVVITAIVVRLILLLSFPNLSDDIYRFIWDGRLTNLGINPYTVLPSDIIDSHPILNLDLFDQLNSPHYYTIYPPLSQLTFYISTFIITESLITEAIVMKCVVFLFEMAGIAGCLKLLDRLNLSASRVSIYALNPLIVVEVMGNLHYEGVMIAMMLWAIYFIFSQRPVLGGVFLGLSALAKLLPLMFIPVIFFYLQKKLRWRFVVTIGITVFLGFLPFMIGAESSGGNLSDSLDLYMRKFEFNGSIYYFLRWIGYGVYGYNMIHVLGPVLALMALSFIGSLALWKGVQVDSQGLIHMMLLSFSAFLFLSMTIHPWYLAVPITLATFGRFRYPMFWSGLIFLTYINYSYPVYSENLIIVSLEYMIVFVAFIYEAVKYGWMDDKLASITSCN